MHFQLVFQVGSKEKAKFSALNLEVMMSINIDPCTHFYSFIKLAVQYKGQTFRASN